MMMHLLRAFAAAAGVVALQHALSASLASDVKKSDSLQLSTSLSDFTERFQSSMTSLMNMLSLNSFQTNPALQDLAIALSFPPEDDKRSVVLCFGTSLALTAIQPRSLAGRCVFSC